MGGGGDIDWEELNAKLPYERTQAAQAKRKKMFKDFDVCRNGYLSLAEADKGMMDVLGRDLHFDARPAIKEAFHYAKDKSSDMSKFGDELLEFREFRLFLQTVRQYFEYYVVFIRIAAPGSSGGVIGFDDKISRDEFCNEEVEHALGRWTNGDLGDMNAEFDAIDVNGGGQILFREFARWALDKNLDIEDEEDLLVDDDYYSKSGVGERSSKRVKSAAASAADDAKKAAGEKKSSSCSLL